MNKTPDPHDWEQDINALLDGELDAIQAEALKQAAGSDEALAAAIVGAYQLREALTAIELEQAPASLSRKLRAIPREQRAPRWLWLRQPRWAMALAAVPLVVALALSQMGPRPPSEAEVAQARQDLTLALAYLQKASRVTEQEIHTTFEQGIGQPVKDNALRTITEQFDLNKEHNT
jgi:anti-sigma factor RsiW